MSESEQLSRNKSKLDVYLWLLIVVLIGIGVAANYYFNSVAWALRLSGWIVLTCVVVPLVFLTASGKKAWGFAKEARGELRKVVWPKRDETVRTTMIVAVMVVVMALILWGVDTVLLWVINLLSGAKG